MDDKTAPLLWRDAAESLLQVCTGYMFFDGFFMYRDTERMGQGWTEFEVMIMGHHFCTVLYMLSCRALRAGHLSTMTLMFFGELTNPFMNGLFISRYAIKLFSNPLLHLLHPWVEIGFALTYASMRAVIGPIVGAYLTYDLLMTRQGRENIPVWISCAWVTLMWIVIIGSWPWTKDSLEMLQDGMTVKFHANYDYGERFVGEL